MIPSDAFCTGTWGHVLGDFEVLALASWLILAASQHGDVLYFRPSSFGVNCCNLCQVCTTCPGGVVLDEFLNSFWDGPCC